MLFAFGAVPLAFHASKLELSRAHSCSMIFSSAGAGSSSPRQRNRVRGLKPFVCRETCDATQRQVVKPSLAFRFFSPGISPLAGTTDLLLRRHRRYGTAFEFPRPLRSSSCFA